MDVVNELMGESTTIHWHGLHQRENPYMDGTPQVTQCPISPFTTFRYTFKADHEGTHWWHSHVAEQRSDGAFGALIIRKPISIQANIQPYDYDLAEHTMVIQDWEHLSAVASFNAFHHSIGDNKPKNILINGKGKYYETKPLPKLTIVDLNTFEKFTEPPAKEFTTELFELNKIPIETTTLNDVTYQKSDDTTLPTETQNNENRTKRSDEKPVLTPLEIFKVKSGKKYRFRTINAGFLNCPVEISIDHHNITVIASDGWYFEPVEVSSLVAYAGERFDFIVNADQPIDNYWLRVRGLMDCDERFTRAHQAAVLRYDGADEIYPVGSPVYEFKRDGLQMNALNKGTNLVDSVSIAELKAIGIEDDPRLLKPDTDFKFYVYYDFYDKDFPRFNNPTLYSNAGE